MNIIMEVIIQSTVRQNYKIILRMTLCLRNVRSDFITSCNANNTAGKYKMLASIKN